MKGQFSKGNIPWNKGEKGIHLSERSEFKQGNVPWNFKNNIEHHKNWGVVIHDPKTKKKHSFAEQVYEEMYKKKVGKHEVVYHKDGDKWNNDSTNLIKITRSLLLKYNRMKSKGININF